MPSLLTCRCCVVREGGVEGRRCSNVSILQLKRQNAVERNGFLFNACLDGWFPSAPLEPLMPHPFIDSWMLGSSCRQQRAIIWCHSRLSPVSPPPPLSFVCLGLPTTPLPLSSLAASSQRAQGNWTNLSQACMSPRLPGRV